MITDTVKETELPYPEFDGTPYGITCWLGNDQPLRNICNYEHTIESNGYVVCKECGFCLDSVYSPYNYTEDHLIFGVIKETKIGYAKERKGVYKRLNMPVYRIERRAIHRLYSKMGHLMSVLSLNEELLKKMYGYMRTVYQHIPKQQSIGRLNTFVPAMSFIVFKQLGVTVTKQEILSVSNITQRNMNQAIVKLKLEYGL